MRTFRAYLDPELSIQPIVGELVELPGEEAHHLLRVLRVRMGDRIILFNGEGATWECSFVSGKGKAVSLKVELEQILERRGPQVFLAQCLAKTKAMELLVRHATELGVSGVIPLQSAHAEVRLDQERGDKRLERLRAIAIEACKQSGNPLLPQVFPVQDIGNWLGALGAPSPGELRMTASLEGDARPLLEHLHEACRECQSITWLVGPEGDLSPGEYRKARECGFSPILLAGQVLRVETAALYALSVTDAYFQSLELR